jgi:hypothetical protein
LEALEESRKGDEIEETTSIELVSRIPSTIPEWVSTCFSKKLVGEGICSQLIILLIADLNHYNTDTIADAEWDHGIYISDRSTHQICT